MQAYVHGRAIVGISHSHTLPSKAHTANAKSTLVSVTGETSEYFCFSWTGYQFVTTELLWQCDTRTHLSAWVERDNLEC